MISGLIYKLRGSFRLENLGGLYNRYPYLSIMFALAMFSLVGTPPLSGFWPKLFLLKASFNDLNWWIILGIIAASFFTLIAIIKIWLAAFWKKHPNYSEAKKRIVWYDLPKIQKFTILLPIAILTVASLYLGLNASKVVEICQLVADQITQPSVYIDAVLFNPENQP